METPEKQYHLQQSSEVVKEWQHFLCSSLPVSKPSPLIFVCFWQPKPLSLLPKEQIAWR